MTRWLVTGAHGMLGRELMHILDADPSARATGATRAALDITDPGALRAAVPGHDIVVNTAAWTDVDAAEAHEAAAAAVNGRAVEDLAQVCAESRVPLLHISTDYVFGGDSTFPYPEYATPRPVNAYGRSKILGERAVTALLPAAGYVVRTTWLYGEHGQNFVKSILHQALRGKQLNVVDDQQGQPTWSRALARQLVKLGHGALAGRAPAGIYHGSSSGQTTWYGLARAVLEHLGLDPDLVRPCSTENLGRPAPRPSYGVLSHDRWALAGIEPMAPWQRMLRAALPGGPETPFEPPTPDSAPGHIDPRRKVPR
ncbi:dTDP-4-dehydrorhamnose reductase [Streptomyces sp. NPDC058576]|uniref:dTDP-4-dehydrorhamnose reductase n=1 Tax=Streptomyces sp. NPDC058576 TaxID=3346547 RepID=UPI0036645A81